MSADAVARCPLTGERGQLLRVRTADELTALYSTYLGCDALGEILKKYLTGSVSEYQSAVSGLRWYSPKVMGGEDYYPKLGESLKWYYGDDSWDKRFVLRRLREKQARSVLEIGCGSGALLRRVHDGGVTAWGIDINSQAIANARASGLNALLPTQLSEIQGDIDCLLMLQTIEHVTDPAAFLRGYVEAVRPSYALISAPCFESLLGHTSDPLCWPPHHATSWSERGLRRLAAAVGYRVTAIHYSPLNWRGFKQRLKREVDGRLFQLPAIPKGYVGQLIYRICRQGNCQWASRGHTILAELSRE